MKIDHDGIFAQLGYHMNFCWATNITQDSLS